MAVKFNFKMYGISKDYDLSYSWIRVTEKETPSNSWHLQLVQDCVQALMENKKSTCFNIEQLEEIIKRAGKKNIPVEYVSCSVGYLLSVKGYVKTYNRKTKEN